MTIANKQSIVVSILKRLKRTGRVEQAYKETFEQRLNRIKGKDLLGQRMPPWNSK